MIEIYADHRETNSGLIEVLRSNPKLNVHSRELSSGDFIIHGTTCIERKSAIDFVASIMDNRLFNQIAKMKLDFANPIILIEGNPLKTYSKIKPEAVIGAMSYCTAIEKVSIITVANVNETAMMITTMARHLQEGLGYEVPLRSNKPKASLHQSQYLVEGLASIGPKNAKALVNHFGSPLKAFNASVEDLCKMNGMGKATAQRIYDALRYEEPQNPAVPDAIV